MGNFSRDGGSRDGRRGGFGGRRSFGGGRSFGGHSNYGRDDRGDRQMFKVVCSNCGKDCEVPFKPTGDKPVYCSDCFEKMGGRDDRRSFDRPRYSDRSSSEDKYKAQLESINIKLDKILSLLEPKNIEDASSPIKNKPVKLRKSSKEKSPQETE